MKPGDHNISTPALLMLAFRPLFLAGALFAVLAVAWWLWFLTASPLWHPWGNPLWWHAHELIFGFGLAIVVGFLLTAAQNWTGVRSLHGRSLAALVLIWVVARVMLFAPAGLPGWLIAAVDLAFALLAAAAVARMVWLARQWRNAAFAPVLLLFAALNGTSHLAIAQQDAALAMQALYSAIMLVMVLVAVIGGRIIPLFTANATDFQYIGHLRWLDGVAVGTLAALVPLALAPGLQQAPAWLLAPLAATSGAAHLARWWRWGARHALPLPLLWSLHLGYLFLPLALFSLALWKMAPNSAAPGAVIHLFTIGAMGLMMLAMISRVSLGHTGRPLRPAKPVAWAFAAIALAAVARAGLPVVAPQLTQLAWLLAGCLWIVAFAVFVRYYAAILVSRRADGRPG